MNKPVESKQSKQPATPIHHSTSVELTRISPLPPPSEYKAYPTDVQEMIRKKFLSDLENTEREIAMVEKEQEHRLRIQSAVVRLQMVIRPIGSVMAFVLCLSFGGLSAYLGYLGHAAAAGAVGTTTVLGLAAIFALGKTIESAENRDDPPSDNEGK